MCFQQHVFMRSSGEIPPPLDHHPNPPPPPSPSGTIKVDSFFFVLFFFRAPWIFECVSRKISGVTFRGAITVDIYGEILHCVIEGGNWSWDQRGQIMSVLWDETRVQRIKPLSDLSRPRTKGEMPLRSCLRYFGCLSLIHNNLENCLGKNMIEYIIIVFFFFFSPVCGF